MAKTSLSLTGDPSVKGAPKDFTLNINDVSISVGAGFVVPICGEVTTVLVSYLSSLFIATSFADIKNARASYTSCHLRYRS